MDKRPEVSKTAPQRKFLRKLRQDRTESSSNIVSIYQYRNPEIDLKKKTGNLEIVRLIYLYNILENCSYICCSFHFVPYELMKLIGEHKMHMHASHASEKMVS